MALSRASALWALLEQPSRSRHEARRASAAAQARRCDACMQFFQKIERVETQSTNVYDLRSRKQPEVAHERMQLVGCIPCGDDAVRRRARRRLRRHPARA